MIFKRKKREESDWWKGIKEAEKLTQEGFSREGKAYFSNLKSAMEAIDLELSGEVKVVGKVVAQNNGNGWEV